MFRQKRCATSSNKLNTTDIDYCCGQGLYSVQYNTSKKKKKKNLTSLGFEPFSLSLTGTNHLRQNAWVNKFEICYKYKVHFITTTKPLTSHWRATDEPLTSHWRATDEPLTSHWRPTDDSPSVARFVIFGETTLLSCVELLFLIVVAKISDNEQRVTKCCDYY